MCIHTVTLSHESPDSEPKIRRRFDSESDGPRACQAELEVSGRHSVLTCQQSHRWRYLWQWGSGGPAGPAGVIAPALKFNEVQFRPAAASRPGATCSSPSGSSSPSSSSSSPSSSSSSPSSRSRTTGAVAAAALTGQ